jgi:hypothetical protein
MEVPRHTWRRGESEGLDFTGAGTPAQVRNGMALRAAAGRL